MALDLNSSQLYFNRELSWLQFNSRVLAQALDDPLRPRRLAAGGGIPRPDIAPAVDPKGIARQLSDEPTDLHLFRRLGLPAGRRTGQFLVPILDLDLALNSTGGQCSLLNDMRQLVGQQPPTLAGFGSVFTTPKDDMVARGKGAGIQRMGCVGGPPVVVHAHARKVVVEMLLERCPDGKGQRLSTTTGPSDQHRSVVGRAACFGPLPVGRAG